MHPPAAAQAWNMRPRAGAFATSANILWRGDGNWAGEGVVLQPGVYSRPIILGGVRNFHGFGIKIQVR